ncbi:DUF2243 domain-containing protein [Actinoplanes auranticolor]|uniref:Membrane protein n=1 Tax=Actinoplanes auranticolor TaxID=47988 RepID=A0A919VW18_9ACTN|nr:DUF2243 domain-containing protein [Actinoplanes auranticolor]GIM77215.1 membrane protein [Actinoplanes auranticolor]
MARLLRAPGLLLGIGLGGFVDGILLHQVLQWHHLLTGTDSDRIGVRYYSPDTVEGLRMNTLFDGLFHVVTWLFVLGGIGLLYSRVTRDRRAAWTSRALWGWMLAGWGLFNLVEGLIDHQILGVHHVREGADQLWWDLGFLALGAVLMVAGWALQRGADERVPVR